MIEEKELKAFFDWIIGIIGHDEWLKRKSDIDAFLNSYYNFKNKPIPLHSKGSVLYETDQFAWYLYLTEARLYHLLDYDYDQGARIIPFFETFGYYLDLVKSIDGIEDVVRRISDDDKKQPDGGIFEIAVALAYKRNGCEEVSFVSTSESKTNDLSIKANGVEWCVECKQKFNKSDYLKGEMEKWLKMWKPLANSIAREYSIILDIVFHRELSYYKDDFLMQEIVPKLRFVHEPVTIIDNDDIIVKVDFPDMKRIKKEFEERDVKISGFDIAQMIIDHYDSTREYSPIFSGAPAKGRRSYVGNMEYCACAIWSCDDEEAYNNKAKSLKGQLSKALKQLPNNKPGIVHVGFESHSGGEVENQRYLNIIREIRNVNIGKKDLQWIYCHIFNPKVPPEDDCGLIEVCYPNSYEYSCETPLKSPRILLSEDINVPNEFDWKQFD